MDFLKVSLGALALSFVATPVLAAPFDQQWALENKGQEACRFDGRNCQVGTPGADIKARDTLRTSRDCRPIITAVLDSGVDKQHPDLIHNLLQGKNFVGDEATDDPQDDNLHGTHVTGIIAASGTVASGVVGVCQRAAILPIKVASAEGYLTDADVLEGIQFAISSGAKVVNASFGGGPASALVKEAIENAKDVLFIIAAGNGNWFGVGFNIDLQPVYPASYDLDNIVAVAATDNQDKLGKFSNFGAKRVHLAAPGVNILSTMPMVATPDMEKYKIPTEMGAIDGTSMATPYVAGATALLWSMNPSMSAAEVKARLLQAVDPLASLEGKVQTGGRLNLSKLF
jgi:subtilisin family serine protease